MKSVQFLFLGLGTSLLLTSCSMNRMATRQLSAALTGQNTVVFTGEEDVELARDALPFTLKLYETMLQRDSTNSGLLLVTAKLFTLYAQAFVLLPADTLPPERDKEMKIIRKRAKRLLLRGREYALRAFSAAHPGAPSLSGKGSIDTLLGNTTEADTALLYWVAASWLGAAAADKSDLGLMMSIRKPIAILKRVGELDDGFDRGAVHELLAVIGATAPKAIGGGKTVAREHFEKAIAFSEGKKLSPYVSFAATLCGEEGGRAEFEQLLKKALAVDTDIERSLRLQNTIYRERARYLLGTIDNCFPPVPAPVDSSAIDIGEAVRE
ncbi:MAG: hypothetical protein JW863_04065 [Chitinispirillaceae bacterium]|nr:hypothetical protein [Chitinispirillaceae bacterium]